MTNTQTQTQTLVPGTAVIHRSSGRNGLVTRLADGSIAVVSCADTGIQHSDTDLDAWRVSPLAAIQRALDGLTIRLDTLAHTASETEWAGDWRAEGTEVRERSHPHYFVGEAGQEDLAQYIATFSPTTVTQLVSTLSAIQSEVAQR